MSTENVEIPEWKEIDQTLSKLDDCDLGAWDRDFVDDMIKRVAQYGPYVRVTGKQWAQIQRMKEQYL